MSSQGRLPEFSDYSELVFKLALHFRCDAVRLEMDGSNVTLQHRPHTLKLVVLVSKRNKLFLVPFIVILIYFNAVYKLHMFYNDPSYQCVMFIVYFSIIVR